MSETKLDFFIKKTISWDKEIVPSHPRGFSRKNFRPTPWDEWDPMELSRLIRSSVLDNDAALNPFQPAPRS